MSETETFRRISGALAGCVYEHGSITAGSVFSAAKRVEGELFKKRHHIREGETWPGGISDGLSLPCGRCGDLPRFDYGVGDDLWAAVVPAEWRRGVVCLPCLDEMAAEKGHDVSQHLVNVQYTGHGKTIVLTPTFAYTYATDE